MLVPTRRQFDNPIFTDALKKVVGVAHKHGKAAAIQPGSPEQAAEWMAIGFNCISYSSDAAVYLAGLRQGVEAVRGLEAKL